MMIKYKNNILKGIARYTQEGIVISNGGERIVPGESDEWTVKSHVDKYVFAGTGIKKGDIILDCACGVGYGSCLLSEKAEQVYGIDIDNNTIEYCRANYFRNNINFITGDANKLDFNDGFFNVVVSYETIEHLSEIDVRVMLKEFKRLLKDSGRLYISTPNRIIDGNYKDGKYTNKFHRIEWSVEEYYNILTSYFNRVSLYGTKVKSENKFNLRYLRSKLLRISGKCDIQMIDYLPDEYHSFNQKSHYQHLSIIGVCEK